MAYEILSRWFRLHHLLLAAACAMGESAWAGPPAARMMPDGSRDMYVGIGVASAPKYKGASARDTDPAALVQAQWSNGIFLSGLSAGMHLSGNPLVEFGPLVAIEPGRSVSGSQKLSGVGGLNDGGFDIAGIMLAPPAIDEVSDEAAIAFTDVPSRPQAGGFFTYYLAENLRITHRLLYGSGLERRGLLFNMGVQKAFALSMPHHRLAMSADVTLANGHYMRSYFGTDDSAIGPSGGLRDVQLTLHWNWELAHPWLLTSQLSLSRLLGSAAGSSLTERRNSVSVRTGIAYRF